MPREIYDHLTDETRDTLTDNVKAMASGWRKSVEYIYQILRSEKADFFAPFEAMYRGACEGGVSTEHWDRRLAYLREKHGPTRPTRDPVAAFRDRFQGQNRLFDRYMIAIPDGLDADETRELLDLIAAERPLTDKLEKSLIAHLAKTERVN